MYSCKTDPERCQCLRHASLWLLLRVEDLQLAGHSSQARHTPLCC